MAGYIKQLLLDLGMNRITIDQRNDIITAIASLQKQGVLSSRDLTCLNLYIEGYNATEIAALVQTTTDSIEILLSRIFTAVETASGYTDEQLINKQSLSSIRIAELAGFLERYGKEFSNHEPRRNN